MRDVEPKRGEEGITLVLRAEHALRDITASARFGARVPGRPPVHGDIDEECHRRHPDGMEIGHEAEESASVAAELLLHRIDAADRPHGLDSQHHDHRHLHGELEEIGNEDAPEAGERRDERRQRDDADHDPESLIFRNAEHQHQDLDHREIDPAENNAVHQHTQVERPETSQECRRFSGVAKFGEFDVGGHAGSPPEPREEEHCQHSACDHVPPEPVAGDSVPRDQSRNYKRSVRGERGCDHRGSGEPPGHVAPRKEELRGIRARFALVVKADQQVEEEIRRNDRPVDGGELHPASFTFSTEGAFSFGGVGKPVENLPEIILIMRSDIQM